MKIIGYQVAHYQSGEHWNFRPSHLVLTLATAISDLNEASLQGDKLYQMIAIKEGDIQEPTFEETSRELVGVSSKLVDYDNRDSVIDASVTIGECGALLLRAKGYSDCTSENDHGVPLIIENSGGELTLRIFGDINQEDPTAVIQLVGASNQARID